MKDFLKNYLDFLDEMCFLYQKSSAEKNLIDALRSFVLKCRQEFKYFVSREKFSEKIKNIQNSVWSITRRDLKNIGHLSATDDLTQNFRRIFKYKGIKNIGNSKTPNFFFIKLLKLVIWLRHCKHYS